jgi:hypothetical protein
MTQAQLKEGSVQPVSLGEVLGTHSDLQSEVVDLMRTLSNARPEALQRANTLLENALRAVRGEIGDTTAPAAPERDSRLQALMEKYQINVLGEGQVSLNLAGSSRIDFLREVQALSPQLHNQNAIWPDRLDSWAKDKAFTAKVAASADSIAIDGNVRGSTNMNRREQETFLKGRDLAMPELCDLAVAHAAYFIATGKGLFGGNAVRARGGALSFDADGLDVYDSYDDFRLRYVSASAALPSRN